MKLVPTDLWEEILEFLNDHVDVRDGPDGTEPRPNKAMILVHRIETEVK